MRAGKLIISLQSLKSGREDLAGAQENKISSSSPTSSSLSQRSTRHTHAATHSTVNSFLRSLPRSSPLFSNLNKFLTAAAASKLGKIFFFAAARVVTAPNPFQAGHVQ